MCEASQCTSLFGDVLLHPCVQGSTKTDDFRHEAGMGGTVIRFGLIAGEILAPERFLGLEVIDGIGGQRVEHRSEPGGVLAESDMAGERIKQLHQLAVLLIDLAQPGVEIVVPGEDVDGFFVAVDVHGDDFSSHPSKIS